MPSRYAPGPGRAGDTVADPGAPVLDCGRSGSIGGMTCTPEKTGMTCTNAQGSGFALSRARQRLF